MKTFARTLASLLVVTTLTMGARCKTQDRPAQQPRDDQSRIPNLYLKLYQQAGKKYGLDWSYIAAVGKIESDHGRTRLPGVHSGANSAGAMGPMQFMPGTWKQYGRGNVYNPADAVPAAARYLKASGAPERWRKALFAYNHSNDYVAKVIAERRSIRKRY
jgi:soluble lytic murein transglycosylase-like protein